MRGNHDLYVFQRGFIGVWHAVFIQIAPHNNQNALIAWLGLGDVENAIWDDDPINVTVNVQGAYPHGDG